MREDSASKREEDGQSDRPLRWCMHHCTDGNHSCESMREPIRHDPWRCCLPDDTSNDAPGREEVKRTGDDLRMMNQLEAKRTRCAVNFDERVYANGRSHTLHAPRWPFTTIRRSVACKVSSAP